jgi:hypothetical protein
VNSINKIGILTLHSGFNEGAVLQAFCLASHLKNSMLNSKVEIIDHSYRSKAMAYGTVRNDKTRALNDFINLSLPLSEKGFLADDHRATFEYIRNNYKIVVTGSDEIWKLRYSKRFFNLVHEQKDPWRPAFPNVYWPDKSIKIPKIAYAASIGQTDWRTIPGKHVKQMRSILSDYTLLGIRDERTMSFLNWLNPDIANKAEMVPDPTFSTDIVSLVDKAMLRGKLQQWGVDFDRPRICTFLRDTPKIKDDLIKAIKKRGFQVVSLSLPNRIADIDLSDKGFTPLEWAAVVSLMDFCISQRMHACISSILHDTPFIAMDIYSNPMDDDTKVKDLMRSFNLLDYYFNIGKDPPEKLPGTIEHLFSKPWPVNEIAQKRSLFQKRSREFTEKIKGILQDTVK